MALKNYDYLSRKISIFYHGRNRHASAFGGILSICLVFLITTYVFYYILTICYHKSSNFISYKTHIKKHEYFEFSKNESSIFHFFQFLSNENNKFTKFNTKYARIFMTRLHNEYKNIYEKLKDNEHWVYDNCREGIDDKNIPERIFNNKTNFENGACLRYYYNNIDKKYYSIDDEENFVYPSLSHGIPTNEILYLNTIIEKCHNDSILHDILGPCETEDEVNKYFDNINDIYMHLLETQVEAENYENSIFYHLTSISGSVGDDDTISINNIYLSPFEIEIKNGIIYPVTQKIKTYTFNQNGKEIWQNNKNNNIYILTVFNYWLINTAQVFKGSYNTLFEALSKIGGIIQCLYYIFTGINAIPNGFKITQDSKNLFFQMTKANIKEEKEKVNFGSMSQIFRENICNKTINNSTFLNNSKIMNSMEQQSKKDSSIKTAKTQSYTNIKHFNKNKNNNENFEINRASTRRLSKFNIYRNKTVNFEKKIIKVNDEIDSISVIPLIENNNINSRNSIIKTKTMDDHKIINEIKLDFHDDIIDKSPEKKNYIHFSQNLSKFILEKRKSIKKPEISSNDLKQFTSLYYFIISIICPKAKKAEFFYIINKFRKKLISEEHLFNNQIFLYYLEKYFDINESEKIDFMELYNYL